MPFSIQPVQVDDAPGLANTADSAFAHDSHWALGWSKDTQLVERVSYSTQRYPWRLIRPESDNQRHQKVVDASTGEVVSYAKWELLNMDDDDLWSEARVDKSSLGPLDFKMYKDMYARADPVAPNDEGADFDTMEWISQKSMIIDVPCLGMCSAPRRTISLGTNTNSSSSNRLSCHTSFLPTSGLWNPPAKARPCSCRRGRVNGRSDVNA